MVMTYAKAATRLASSLLIGGCIGSLTAMPASAQTAPADQIIHTLAPTGPAAPAAPAVSGAPAASGAAAIPFVTRNLSLKRNPTAAAEPSAASDPDAAFIDGLRHRGQSLSTEEGDRVAEIAKTRTKMDLEVEFYYGSATVAATAMPQLNELGTALRSPQLQNAVLVIGGHTDAKGTERFNQNLSERRSEAVKNYLVDRYKIPADHLITAGYGKRDLKNKNDPYAAENRRVEIVNMSATLQANR